MLAFSAPSLVSSRTPSAGRAGGAPRRGLGGQLELLSLAMGEERVVLEIGERSFEGRLGFPDLNRGVFPFDSAQLRDASGVMEAQRAWLVIPVGRTEFHFPVMIAQTGAQGQLDLSIAPSAQRLAG